MSDDYARPREQRRHSLPVALHDFLLKKVQYNTYTRGTYNICGSFILVGPILYYIGTIKISGNASIQKRELKLIFMKFIKFISKNYLNDKNNLYNPINQH